MGRILHAPSIAQIGIGEIRTGRTARSTRTRPPWDAGAGTLTYLYDFGDGWEHTVRLLRFDDAEPGTKYPVLVEATGRCPPEDVGVPWGYADFLDAIADPDHKQHDNMKEWHGDVFDPEDAPLDRLKADVADLATRWNRASNRTAIALRVAFHTCPDPPAPAAIQTIAYGL